MLHAFDGLIIEIDMRASDFLGQARWIHGKAVILGRNLDIIQIGVQYRLIPSMVPELQLERLSTKRQTHDLVAQTNPEDRFLPEQVLHVPNRVVHGLRIARTIGKKDAVGLEVQNFLSWSLRWHDGNAPSQMNQIAQDVGLDTEVVRDDMAIRWFSACKAGELDECQRFIRSGIRLLDADSAGEVQPYHVRRIFH